MNVGELKSWWNWSRPTFILLLFSFETSNRRNRVTQPHVKGTSDERGCFTINDNGSKIPEWRTFFSEKKIGTGFVEACDDESIHFLGAGILIWISRYWGHTHPHTHEHAHPHPPTHTHIHTHTHEHAHAHTRHQASIKKHFYWKRKPSVPILEPTFKILKANGSFWSLWISLGACLAIV